MKIHGILHDLLIKKKIQARALHGQTIRDTTEIMIMEAIYKNIQRLEHSTTASLFIPQLMNFELIRERKESYKYWMPGITEQKAAAYCQELSRYCQKKLPAKSYLSCTEDLWSTDHFLDSGHFSVEGCRQFADLITAHLLQYELID